MLQGKFMFIPIEEATAPTAPGLFEHVVNSWWITDPERGLAFFTRGYKHPLHPQSNRNETLARRMADGNLGIKYDFTPEVVYLESVWVPRKDM